MSSLRLSVSILASALLLLSCSRESTYPISRLQPLDEAVAIEVTLRALQESGIDPIELKPVEYSPSPSAGMDRFFARNVNDPNRGYVLWRRAESEKVWDFQVYVRRDEHSLHCKITKGF
jgi:hypothetical protein